MEDFKKQNDQMVGEGGVDKPKKKKKLALFVILGVLLVAGISAIYFFIIRKENLLSFIE